MSDAKHAKLIIIGSGPAGYTAAVYAARAMLEPVLVRGIQPGGQLTITTDVENYPGFADPMQGPVADGANGSPSRQCRHGNYFRHHHRGADLTCAPSLTKGDSGQIFTADTVVIATGAQAKWLGLPSEDKFQGFGVSACATCDGFFYRNKKVLVVGGGNTAVEEALFLTNFASEVTLVHRRDSCAARKFSNSVCWRMRKSMCCGTARLMKLLGDENPLGVTGARIKNTKTGEDA